MIHLVNKVALNRKSLRFYNSMVLLKNALNIPDTKITQYTVPCLKHISEFRSALSTDQAWTCWHTSDRCNSTRPCCVQMNTYTPSWVLEYSLDTNHSCPHRGSCL